MGPLLSMNILKSNKTKFHEMFSKIKKSYWIKKAKSFCSLELNFPMDPQVKQKMFWHCKVSKRFDIVLRAIFVNTCLKPLSHFGSLFLTNMNRFCIERIKNLRNSQETVGSNIQLQRPAASPGPEVHVTKTHACCSLKHVQYLT